jgi:hypothetical protein
MKRGAYQKTTSGFTLALAIIVLAVLGMIGFGLVFATSRSLNTGLAVTKIDNKLHGAVVGAEKIIEYKLRRPDDPSSAHVWDSNVTQPVYSIDVNGVKVWVKVEDKEIE